MERERGRRQELVKDLRAEARQLLDRLAWIGDRDQRRWLARSGLFETPIGVITRSTDSGSGLPA